MDKYSRVQKKIKSPRREAINKQLNEHTNRIKQLMQQDYVALQQQNIQLKKKCVKYNQLEQKVELVLKHNQSLCIENEKLSKLTEDKINECEFLKKKLESAKRANQGLNEYERKKLLIQIQRLQKQIEEIQHFKNLTIKQIKTKNLMQIQGIRREHESDIKYLEDQLIKLKENSDKKDIQINVLQAKYRKLEGETHYQLSQFKQQKAKLKEQLKRFQSQNKLFVQLKQQHQKFIQQRKKYEQNNSLKINQLTRQYDKLLSLKKKQDQNNSLIIRELTQKHQRLLQNKKKQEENILNKNKQVLQKLRLQNQQSKNLKDRLQQLQQQNGNLHSKLKRMQKKFEQSDQKVQMLKQIKEEGENNELKMRRQIESLRNQIKQLNIINDKQIQALQYKFQSLRDQQISEIRIANQNYKIYMQDQIAKLNEIIRIKDNQLNYLSEQKSIMKQTFIEQGNQMKNELILLQEQFKQNQLEHEQQIKRLQQQLLVKLKKCQNGASEHIHKLQSDCFNLDKQKRKLVEEFNKKSTQNLAYKQIIQNQKEEIKQNLKKAEDKQKLLKKSQQQWKKSCIDMKNRLQMEQANWDKQRKEISKAHQQKSKQFMNQIKQRQKIITELQKQNQSIKQFVRNRDKNIGQSNKKITQLNSLIDQRNQIIDDLRNKLINQSQNSSLKLQNEKKSLQQYYSSKIKFLTQDFQTKIFLLEKNIQDLNIQLNQKNEQIQQLLRQYKVMRDQMIILTQQQANKKQVTLKFAGSTANLIATKNMFDVFIKEKVINLCSDAITDAVFRDQNNENIKK